MSNREEIWATFETLMDSYNEVKSFIRRTDRHEYERWKAGGFLVDSDIISDYPILEEVLEKLLGDRYENEDDSED